MNNPVFKGFNMRTVVIVVLALFLVACGSRGDKRVETIADQGSNSMLDAQAEAMFNGPIQNLVFQPGDHRLNSESRMALDKLIAELVRNPGVSISLGGHTDNRGSATANLELSKNRVMSVVRYLVSNGIEGSRLKPYGFGESSPVVSNATPEGRIRNRRIEVDIIEQKVITQ